MADETTKTSINEMRVNAIRALFAAMALGIREIEDDIVVDPEDAKHEANTVATLAEAIVLLSRPITESTF
jgi:hypothetical protein